MTAQMVQLMEEIRSMKLAFDGFMGACEHKFGPGDTQPTTTQQTTPPSPPAPQEGHKTKEDSETTAEKQE